MPRNSDFHLNQSSDDTAKSKLMSERKKQLDSSAVQVQSEIRNCFKNLKEILRFREKQLLRQTEAIVHAQKLSLAQSNTFHTLGVDLSYEKELTQLMLNFGKLDLPSCIVLGDSEFYKIEDYEDDTINFEKSLVIDEDDHFFTSDTSNVSKSLSWSFNDSTADGSKIETKINQTEASSQEVKEYAQEGSVKKFVICEDFEDSNFISSECIEETSQFQNDYQNPIVIEQVIDNEVPVKIKMEQPVSITVEINSDDNFENGNYKDDSNDSEKCHVNNNPKENTTENVDSNNTEDKTFVKEKAEETEINPSKDKKKLKDCTGHPVQIQQWLEQIFAETETEPIIHEINGQFSEISNARLYFPVET